MILHTVRVQNFKSVIDSTSFEVDEKVTYLVGKNESGKTTLLQAISKLNPVDPANADFAVLEYPRSRMVAYQQRAETEPDEVLTTTWFLSQEDIADLEEILGPAARELNSVEISKGYRNDTIADVLSRDVKTIERHINNIYSKLNSDNDEGPQESRHPRVRSTLTYLKATGMLPNQQFFDE